MYWTMLSRMRNDSIFLMIGMGVLLVMSALLIRPLLPVDETRYLTVAWEMWSRGDFLVPYLNGEVYSHKPPLLFWLFHLGWSLFGINEWWPRLVAPLLSLACLFLTMRLFSVLWPERQELARLPAWFLLGIGFWTLFLTLTQFDLLIVFSTLLAMLAMLYARQHKVGWVWLGFALGLGLLSKGPVILLHVLPVTLLAPFWMNKPSSMRWWHWYIGVLVAVIIGAIIVLTWALPAAEAGGEAYRQAIFWGQTAERMVNSFAHRQAWWWYLPMLPLVLLPWSLWPQLWRSTYRLPKSFWQEQSVRFLMYWIVPVFIAFSLVSGKQIKYLLPLFPALSLLAIAILMEDSSRQRIRLWLPGLMLILMGVILLVLPFITQTEWADWLREVPVGWGLLLILLGLWRIKVKVNDWQSAISATAISSLCLMIVLHLSVISSGASAYSLEKPAQIIAQLQQQGYLIANGAKYHGQFHFLGRLQQPLQVVHGAQMMDWIEDHPQAYIVMYYKQWSSQLKNATYAQVYRSGALAIWSAKQVQMAPELLDRKLGQKVIKVKNDE